MSADTIITLIVAVFASTGFWSFVTSTLQKRSTKLDDRDRLLMGIAHDRICHLGEEYLQRGYITKDEYESMHDYLYTPYRSLGGNGTAEKIMSEVNKLPIGDKIKKE